MQPCHLHLCPLAGKLDITPDDPRWIGAWWGGFLLCGALLFFSSLPMFGFPQSLPPRPERRGERAGHASREGLREGQAEQRGPAAPAGRGEQHNLLPAAAR